MLKSMRIKGIALFIFTCTFVWGASTASAATTTAQVISQYTNASEPYDTLYGSNVNFNSQRYLVATGTLSYFVAPVASTGGLTGSERFSVKLFNNYFSQWIDCQTPTRTADEWGITRIARDPHAPLVSFGPFSGSKCLIDDDKGGYLPISIFVRVGEGPTHASVGVMGSSAVSGFNFTAYGPDIPPAAPPDPCAVPGACASNVLFLPGIEASRLYATSTDIFGVTHEDQLWEPNNNGDAEELSLTADGVSIKENIYTREVLDEKNVLPIGQGNIYKSFITQMNGLKNEDKIINDWKAAPYDWRFALDDILSKGAERNGNIYYEDATSTPYIEQTLRALAASSKTGKVTIVAHSNGGLVAKALTEKLGSEAAALIDKMIFVAVPQVGTPQAVGALLHGYDQGLPFDWLPIILSPGTARTLAKNMPMTYNLLPSFDYFTQVNESVVTFDDSNILSEFRTRYGSSIHDSTLLKNFITDTRRLAASSPSDLIYPAVGNAALYSLAETAHASLDAWTPPQGVSFYEIAGWGEDTLATIEYKEGKKTVCAGTVSPSGTCSRFTTVPTVSYYPKEVIGGDGTVLAPSALWTPSSSTAAKYWVNLKKYNNSLPGSLSHLDRKHADILEISPLRTLVQNILTNSTSTLPAFITTVQPAATSGDNRLRFLLHSPLNLSATDSFGNVVNSATSTIPGARWKRYGEVQVLTVPAGTSVTLGLDGYATGSFTLDLEEIDGSSTVTASSTFAAIPSATSTRATMAFTDGTLQGASPLLLDYDGDGATDFSLNSKIGEEVVLDTTPPEATLTFDPVSQKFSVIGSDDVSTTTVSTTATSTTITDESGNTLQIIFRKLKQEKKEMKIEIRELRYNGVSFGTIPKTVLQYEWSTDKKGKPKEFEEKVEANSLVVTGHYDAKKNVTKIEEKVKDNKDKKQKGWGDDGEKHGKDKETKDTLPGLVILGLTTSGGEVEISY